MLKSEKKVEIAPAINGKHDHKDEEENEQKLILNGGKNENHYYNSLCRCTGKLSIFSKITVEPISAVAGFVIWMTQTSTQNLYLETACTIDYGHPKNECFFGFGEDSPHEVESQRLVASVNIVRGLIDSILTSALLLFICPWSDFSGRRKPPLLIPIIGMTIASFNALLVLSFPRIQVSWVIYLLQIPQSAGGREILLFAAMFNYIGDICYSTGRNTLTSMVYLFASHFGFIVIGAILGPVVYRNFGFYGVFSTTFIIQIILILYICKYLKEVNENKNNKVSIYSLRLPLSALKCVFKRREGYKRCCILLALAVDALDKIIYSGTLNIEYLFLRNKFEWSDYLYGMFVSFKCVITFFSLLFILFVISKRFGASDNMIGIIGGLSQAVGNLTMVLAPNSYIIFLSPVIAFLAQGTVVVLRPIINNQIKADEQGKISSVQGALNSLILVAFNPFYNAVYKVTVDVFPAAYLVGNVIVALLQTSSYLIIKRIIRKQDKNVEQIMEAKPMNKNNGLT